MASIIVPRKLGDKLKEKAAEVGYLPDELGVEILRKNLDEELDPEDLVEQYQTLSENEMTREMVEVAAEDVNKLITKLKEER